MLDKETGRISTLGSVIQKARESAQKNKRLWLVLALALGAVIVITLAVVL